MNRSGEVIPGLLRKRNLPLGNLLVICDTLDLPPGSARLKRKGSSAGHRGLQSIIESVGSGDFLRIYIGVGRPDTKGNVVQYVLETPAAEEAALINSCIASAAEATLALSRTDVNTVIESFNASNHA